MGASFYSVTVLLLFGIKVSTKGMLYSNYSDSSCVPEAEPHPESEHIQIYQNNIQFSCAEFLPCELKSKINK